MGMFAHNFAVKTKDTKKVRSILENEHRTAYVAEPENGWIQIYPENELQIENLAQQISSNLSTVAVSGVVVDSDDLLFKIYDKGNLIFGFIYDRTNGKGGIIEKGDKTTLSRYSKEGSASIDHILTSDSEEYVFTEDRYRDLLKLLNLPVALGNFSYQYINRAKEQKEAQQLLKEQLPKIKKITFKKEKTASAGTWESFYAKDFFDVEKWERRFSEKCNVVFNIPPYLQIGSDFLFSEAGGSKTDVAGLWGFDFANAGPFSLTQDGVLVGCSDKAYKDNEELLEAMKKHTKDVEKFYDSKLEVEKDKSIKIWDTEVLKIKIKGKYYEDYKSICIHTTKKHSYIILVSLKSEENSIMHHGVVDVFNGLQFVDIYQK